MRSATAQPSIRSCPIITIWQTPTPTEDVEIVDDSTCRGFVLSLLLLVGAVLAGLGLETSVTRALLASGACDVMAAALGVSWVRQGSPEPIGAERP